MKTIIKLAIALALANAAVRAGLVAMAYYQLKDAAQQEVTWGGRIAPAELATHVLEKAAELDVPLEADGVAASRNEDVTVISVAYTQPVELFPAFIYPVIYPVDLEFEVQARTMTGLK
ncbi:MAG: hypothetical protein HOP16_09215 [Acidobacteria bacterium]|nr:hypothetical protein [Acidobacteriota bacterium]